MGIWPDAQMSEFLRGARAAGTNTLIDDLREAMSVLHPRERFKLWSSQLSFRETKIKFDMLQKQTAWKTPMEICIELERPLLAGYYWKPKELHPVVKAFQWESCTHLGLSPEEMIP